MSFLKKWEERGGFSKVKGPLKPKIEEAIKIINLQMQRLDLKGAKIREYDRTLFEKVVYYYRSRDLTRAKMYANELTEVRKLAKLIVTSRLTLEQIVMRLGTVKEYGDVAASVAPALFAVKRIYGGVTQLIPEADQSFQKLGDVLDGLMVEASQYSNQMLSPAYIAEEGQNILQSAAKIAENDLAKTLPKIPGIEDIKEKEGLHT
ncbi:MAG: Snf7 family protein [Candidatus Methanomethyliaceae archaeon]|nr:Snf7 family protein [Candidatus Methanomethyliaceae archaeon]